MNVKIQYFLTIYRLAIASRGLFRIIITITLLYRSPYSYIVRVTTQNLQKGYYSLGELKK